MKVTNNSRVSFLIDALSFTATHFFSLLNIRTERRRKQRKMKEKKGTETQKRSPSLTRVNKTANQGTVERPRQSPHQSISCTRSAAEGKVAFTY